MLQELLCCVLCARCVLCPLPAASPAAAGAAQSRDLGGSLSWCIAACLRARAVPSAAMSCARVGVTAVTRTARPAAACPVLMETAGRSGFERVSILSGLQKCLC